MLNFAKAVLPLSKSAVCLSRSPLFEQVTAADVLTLILNILVKWCSSKLLKAYRAGQTANAGSFFAFHFSVSWDQRLRLQDGEAYTSLVTVVLSTGMRELFQTCLRDGPLEKLWEGGWGISSRRNFFSLSSSFYEFFLGHSMKIF